MDDELVKLAEEVLKRPPAKLDEETLRRMADEAVEFGCAYDRSVQKAGE